MVVNTLFVEASKCCKAACDVVGSVHGLGENHSSLLGGHANINHIFVQVQSLFQKLCVGFVSGIPSTFTYCGVRDKAYTSFPTPLLDTALWPATPHFRHVELRLIIHIPS